MAGVTRCMMVAWERECRGLSLEQMGILWTLTAAAECGWFGTGGVIRATERAVADLMNSGEERGRVALELQALRKRGKLTVREAGDAGSDGKVLEIGVCLWSDRWARERKKKLGGRS